MTQKLWRTQKAGRWVPHVFNHENKITCYDALMLLLSRLGQKDLMYKFATVDEKWVLYDNQRRLKSQILRKQIYIWEKMLLWCGGISGRFCYEIPNLVKLLIRNVSRSKWSNSVMWWKCKNCFQRWWNSPSCGLFSRPHPFRLLPAPGSCYRVFNFPANSKNPSMTSLDENHRIFSEVKCKSYLKGDRNV